MWSVINSIPLIGWNYSFQTGEYISTNDSTGHVVYIRLIVKSYRQKRPWAGLSQFDSLDFVNFWYFLSMFWSAFSLD